jgi:hypothetical protein
MNVIGGGPVTAQSQRNWWCMTRIEVQADCGYGLMHYLACFGSSLAYDS